ATGARRGRVPEIAAEPLLAPLADRHHPPLAPRPSYPNRLGLEVDVVAAEAADLVGAKPAAVGELEHRPVADLERGRGRDPVEQARRLLGAEDAGKPRAALRAREELARVRFGGAGANQMLAEAADRRQLPRHGRARQPPRR